MFFKQVRRNSRKMRKENGLHFLSLVISIVAFYTILSLGQQDVITFLRTMESQAVQRLLLFIPAIYLVSLFFVFFMVLFASRYHLQQRNHEIGLYMMLGMKRSKIYALLLLETLWNSGIALAVGLPISLFLTEVTGMAISKAVGIGIIGHQFNISWPGILWTVVGFLAIQLLVMFVLSLQLSRKEPLDLMSGEKEKAQKTVSPLRSFISLLLGILLLASAYTMGILFLKSISYIIMLLIFCLGALGTFLLFYGLGAFIGGWIRKKGSKSTGLFVFTGRQLQENVINQVVSLTISSLLILMAAVCFSYGVATAATGSGNIKRTVDFSFCGEQSEVLALLKSDQVNPYLEAYYPMHLSMLETQVLEEEASADKNWHTFSWEGFTEVIASLADSDEKDTHLSGLLYSDSFYFIKLSSYNYMRQSSGQQPVVLGTNELALFSNADLSSGHGVLKEALKRQTY